MTRARLVHVRELIEERKTLLRDIRTEQQQLTRELEIARGRQRRAGEGLTYSGRMSPARPGRGCPRMRVADISAFLK